ncbi:MAG TPA: TolC family protein [Bryobacteraceae bacterium]
MPRLSRSGVFVLLSGVFMACARSQGSDRPPSVSETAEPHHFEWFRRPFQPKRVSEVDPDNSPRIDRLMRAGNIYLSLADALALAIENNLDLAAARYQIPIAQTDTLRAKGGGTLRGVSLGVFDVPQGVGGPAGPLVTAAASGPPGTSLATSIYDLSLFNRTSSSLSLDPSSQSSPLPAATGPPIPQYDPSLNGTLSWMRQSMPEQSSLATGTSTLHEDSLTGSLMLQQGFSTGTTYSLGYNSTSASSNSMRNAYDPSTTGGLGLTVTQPLLRGFGIAVNRRYISIAKNNQKISDLVFRQQVIEVVYGVSRLYYDLASLYVDLRVKRETLTAAKALYDNTKARVEEGVLADVELTRANAQVAAANQDLINSQGLFDEQELIVKRLITRRVPSDSGLAEAHIIPTETLTVPAADNLPPLPELLSNAVRQRADVEQARLQLTNSGISLKGSRNELLPELNVFAMAQNSALSGQPNSQMTSGSTGASGSTGLTSSMPDASQTGGYGNFLNQIATNRFPTYEVGIQLNLPIRNRIAQADVTRDELAQRSYQTRLLSLENQAQTEAEGAVIAIRRARASYDAAVTTRQLQAQSLEVEQARFDAGVSTAFMVILYQSYLAQARSTEVIARGNYFKARAALDRAVGSNLDVNRIELEDAYKGKVP